MVTGGGPAAVASLGVTSAWSADVCGLRCPCPSPPGDRPASPAVGDACPKATGTRGGPVVLPPSLLSQASRTWL